MSDPVSLLTGKSFAALETAGNKIVDQDGEAVFIKAINWYGMELESFGVPAGVDQQSVADILQSVADLGFNTLRLPFSTQAVLDPYEVAPWFGIDLDKNPALEGANSLEVLQHVIDEAARIGLSVIVDNHNISSAGWEGRWYDGDYSEAEWIGMWESLAATLSEKDNVIGADLRNEPYAAAWENWSTAAEAAGNGIHAVDDDWLVIVEGVHHSADGDWYQWGGNLKDAHADPIVLDVDNKVVYSAHEYPEPVERKLGWEPDATYYSLFDEFWGSISQDLNAPVLIGEFGFKGAEADAGWTEALTNYILGDLDGDGVIDEGGSPIAGFAYWNLNPPESKGQNLFDADLETVRAEVWADLAPLIGLEPEWLGTVPSGGGTPDPDPDPDPVLPTLENAFSLALTVNSDWGNGASITIAVTNESQVAIASGSIEVAFDAPSDLSVWIDQLYRAELIDDDADVPVFRLAPGGDGKLDPGETVDFLFVASYDGTWNVSALGATTADLSVVAADLPTAGNNAPVAADVVLVGEEDTALDIAGADLLAGASDADGDTLTLTAVGDAEHGTAALVDGDVIYTPDADYFGTDSFTYTVSDGNGGEASATVTVDIAGVNDAPTAQDIAITLDEDGRYVIRNAELEALGFDPDGDPLQIDIGLDPETGRVKWNGNGLVYRPKADFHGDDVFTLTYTDGEATATATVNVSILPVQDAPTAQDISFTVDEDGRHIIKYRELDDIGFDVDGDPLEVSIGTDAAHGTLLWRPNGLVYRPDTGVSGADAFTLDFTDGNATATATVDIWIEPANDAPTIDDFTVTLDEDTGRLISIAEILGHASDPDGDTLTVDAVSAAAMGTVSLGPDGILYTPPAEFSGTDSVEVTVSDGMGGTDTATLTLNVMSMNDAPVAGDMMLAAEAGATERLDIAALLAACFDADGDSLSLAAFGASLHGTLERVGDALVYTANAGFSGTETITYTLSDGHGGMAQGAIVVTVEPAADEAPEPGALSFQIIEEIDWGNGAFYNVAYTNVGGSAIDYGDLTIGFDPAQAVEIRDGQVWGGAEIHGAGDGVTFGVLPDDADGVLSVGETQTLGFVLDYPGTWNVSQLGATASDFSAAMAEGSNIAASIPDVSLALRNVNDWGTGAVVRLDVTNDGDAALSFDDFAVAFDGDRDVSVRERIFEAEIVSADPGCPVFALAPTDGAQMLGAGEMRSFVFIADYDGAYGTQSLGVTLDDFMTIPVDGPFI